jgi:hypothetical protein
VTYAPLDDRFDDHPKYAKLSAGHMGVLACAITYCNRNLSDGVVPAEWPYRRFGAAGSQLVRSLIALGVLSRRSDGDLEVVGYLDHNPSKEQVISKRDKKSRAGAKGGQASAAARAVATAEASAQVPGSPTSLHYTSLKRERERTRAPDDLEAGEPETGSGVRLAAPISPPVSGQRYVEPGDKLTDELRDAAVIIGVRDVDTAWLKFTGKHAGQWRHVAGAWQSFCASWRGIEQKEAQLRKAPIANGNPNPVSRSAEPTAAELAAAVERAREEVAQQAKAGGK